jgi:hypothetical protein
MVNGAATPGASRLHPGGCDTLALILRVAVGAERVHEAAVHRLEGLAYHHQIDGAHDALRLGLGAVVLIAQADCDLEAGRGIVAGVRERQRSPLGNRGESHGSSDIGASRN